MSNDKQAVAVYQAQPVPAPSTGLALPEAMQLGKVLADSGYFGDRLSAAQAVVKIIKGQSLGIDPVSAMQGMEFVQGKLTMSAGLIASLIQRSERYRYDVREHDDEHCVIEFWDMGQRPARSLGTSPYSMDDAKKAGLAGRDMWTKYRRNMLFARALTNGARWYCPAVFNGPVYTPDEMRDSPEPEPPREYDAATGERQPEPRPTPLRGKPGGGHEQAARAGAVAAMATTAAAEGDTPSVTPAQVRAIYMIGRDSHRMSEADVDARCQNDYGTRPEGLTKRQASEFISALQRPAPPTHLTAEAEYTDPADDGLPFASEG